MSKQDWLKKEAKPKKGGKLEALASFLGVDPSEVEDKGDNDFSTQDAEYKVLTDEEANELCRQYIEDSLWAFNASFIISHTELPSEAQEMLESFQEAKSEGANETIKALIEDMDSFVEDAISADGRGHFMNTYDGEENEQGGFYIYRTN